MKKTQVALAALALVASTAALADDVTISGNLDFAYQSSNHAYDVTNNGTSGSVNRLATANMSPNFIIVSANEDLGGGSKINFTAQNLIDRSAFNPLGLKLTLSGGFGDVTIGNWLDPMFLVLAPHSASTDGGSNIGGFVTPFFASNISGIWVKNQVAYTTPDFGGLKATAFYRAGGVAGDSGSNSASGITGSFGAGAFGLGAGYSSVKGNGSATEAVDSTVIGTSYDLGSLKIGGMYMHAKDNFADMTKNTWGVNFSVPVDAWSFGMGYYTTKVANSDAKGQDFIVHAKYALSKRTSLFANVENVKNTTSAVYTTNAGYTDCGTNVGSCDNTHPGFYDGANIGSTTVTTVGIRHSF